MIVLSFDTSLAACSAAVVDVGENARVLSALNREPGKGHAEMLLDMIGDVMGTAQVEFDDISKLVITLGPGSFTGVRVALSAARGFSIAHNIPICSLPTTQAIAANISKVEAPAPHHSIAVIIDARRNQAYGQIFDSALNPISAPLLIAVDELETWLEPWNDMPITLMGSGTELLVSKDNVLPENWTRIKDHTLPDAACFALAFKDMVPDDVSPDPIYLREPDAKPQIIGQISV